MRFSTTLGVVLIFCAPVRADDLPSPLGVRQLLEEVARRNPQLAEKRKRAAAAAQRPRTVQPEDPMAMLEWWQQPVDFSMVPIMLTIKQPLPLLGKLRARREVLAREAAVLSDEAGEVERRLLAEAKRAYFDLALADGSLAINDKVRALLEHLVAVTDTQYRVGKTVQTDLLKAQGELLVVENERLDLDRERSEASARINGLLDRDATTALPSLADQPRLISLPPAAELVARALADRPELRRAKAELAAAEARAALARRENHPELAVWSSYMVAFNGTNTFTLGFSSTLPAFSTVKKRAAVEETRAEIEAARKSLAAAQRAAEVEVQTTLLRLDSSARHVKLHADKLVPLADLTLQSAQASYQAGRIDFSAVLEAARMVRDHHLNHLKFLVEYERRLADLEQIVGGELGGAR